MTTLSIITINYNDVDGLNATKTSVLPQLSEGIEWIVIDGGSTDGSRDVIESCKDRISYWVSEPDSGIYNAMNKGIAKATGDYLLFLNSGDRLNPEINIRQCLEEIEGSDFEVFDIMISHKGKVVGTKVVSDITTTPIMYYLLQNTFPHQSTLIRRSLFDIYGLYDESLKISSDWAFYLKAFAKGNPSYHYNHKSLSIYDDGGISTTINQRQVALERHEVLKAYLSIPVIIAIAQGERLYSFRQTLYNNKINTLLINVLLKINSLFSSYASKS